MRGLMVVQHRSQQLAFWMILSLALISSMTCFLKKVGKTRAIRLRPMGVAMGDRRTLMMIGSV